MLEVHTLPLESLLKGFESKDVSRLFSIIFNLEYDCWIWPLMKRGTAGATPISSAPMVECKGSSGPGKLVEFMINKK